MYIIISKYYIEEYFVYSVILQLFRVLLPQNSVYANCRTKYVQAQAELGGWEEGILTNRMH